MAPVVSLSLVLALALMATPRAEGQAVRPSTFEILGRIVDPGDHPLPDRRIELQRPDRFGPGRLVTRTDAEGRFSYPRLEAGTYRVVLIDEGRDVASERVRLSDASGTSVEVTLHEPAKELRRTSAGRFLRGRTVLSDFGELRDRVSSGGYGYEVIVTDRSGRKMRGRITTISSNGLELNTKSTLPLARALAPKERAFPKESIAKVQIVDSMWNGFWMGMAATFAAPFALAPVCGGSQGCVYFAALAVGALPTLGMAIDSEINAPIYLNPSASRVQLGLAAGPGAHGIAAQVRVRF